jgi:hypothetical protein
MAARLLSRRLEQLGDRGQKRMGWEMAVYIEKILCTVRGARAAGGGDDGDPLRGAGGLLRRLAALNGSTR